MSRRWLILLVVMTLLFTNPLGYRQSGASVGPVIITIDGRPIKADVAPVIISGRTMVPFRTIFEALGARVDYDILTDIAKGTKGHITVSLPLGKSTAYVNGAEVSIDVPPAVINGRTMVPGRFVAEALGASVNWVQATNTVVIMSKVEPKVGGRVVLPIGGDPTSLNPLFTADSMSMSVWGFVFNGLLRTNERSELIGDLAEDWDISNENLTLTFRVRQNVYWHDGVKLTAQDIKFTYDSIMHPDYAGVRANDFAAVKGISCPDDYTLVIQLKNADAAFQSKLTIGILPLHIFQGTTLAQLREHPQSRAPIGTGPFVFKEWVSDQHILLERNPNYFWAGSEPYIGEILFRVYADTQAAVAAFKAGAIDYLGSLPLDEVKLIKKTYSSQYDFRDCRANGYWYIGLKQSHPVLGDKLVRQALTYGLDRQTIVRSLYKGHAVVMHADQPPTSWAYNPNLNPYAYNKTTAIQLLTVAGWSEVGSDGIRLNSNGERLSFTLISAIGNQARENLLHIIKNQWKDIGVEVIVELCDISTFYTRLDTGDFAAYQWGWDLGSDPDNYIFWHSTASFDEYGVLQGLNDVGFVNQRVDELVEAGRATFNQEERRKIYWEIQAILNEELPYVFLYSIDSVAALSRRILGDLWSAIGYVFPELWYIK